MRTYKISLIMSFFQVLDEDEGKHPEGVSLALKLAAAQGVEKVNYILYFSSLLAWNLTGRCFLYFFLGLHY